MAGDLGSGVAGRAFTWTALQSRVVFGRDSSQRVHDEISRLEKNRALLVGGAAATHHALTRVQDAMGDLAVGAVGGATQDVPPDVVDAAVSTARDVGADVIVAVGGGSATGLGKILAFSCDLPLVAVPTTYSGSEMTAVWGRITDGRKHTAYDIRVLPRSVVYDPELCAGMPARLAAASGMNALAHCLEALWSKHANPITSALAVEAGRRLVNNLPRVVTDADDIDAHGENLIGACLAGVVMAQAGMGIHHRSAHVLGGGWKLPHAETHSVLLPRSTALVSPRAPLAMQDASRIFSSADVPGALFALLQQLQLPTGLAELGMPEDGLDEAARRIMEATHNDPLVPDEAAVRRMLDDAFFGRQPHVAA